MGIEFDLLDCEIPEEAKCSICFKVIEDAVKIEYNQNECHVCKNCCIDHFEKECNNDVEFGEITWDTADDQVIAAIESLTMKCPNITYGCKAVFPMNDSATHAQYCGWRPFQCRWKCGTTLALQKVRLHEQWCDMKPETNQKSKNLNDKHSEIEIENLTECTEDAFAADEYSEVCDDADHSGIESNIEVDVHRDIDGYEELETVTGQQRFGALYKKVANLEEIFLKFEQNVHKMNEEHTKEVKNLYDYSYELMQTMKTQTQQDIESLKTEVLYKQKEKNRKKLIKFKQCTIQ